MNRPSGILRGILLPLLTLLLLSVGGPSRAEEHQQETDSLRQLLTNLSGKERLDVLKRLTYLSQFSENSSYNRKCIIDFLIEAQRQHDLKAEGDARVSLIGYFFNRLILDSLVSEVPKQMEFFRKNGQWDRFYYAWRAKIEYYAFDQHYSLALHEAETMNRDAKERKDDYGMAYSNYCLGLVYENMGNHEEAIKAFKLCLEHKELDNRLARSAYFNTCEALAAQKEYVQLLLYADSYWKSIVASHPGWSAERLESTPQATSYYTFLAQAHTGVGHWDEAKKYLDKALPNAKKRTNQWHHMLCALTSYHLARENHAEALKYSEELLELSKEMKVEMRLSKAEELRSDALLAAGRYQEAAKLLKNIHERDRKNNSAEMQRQLTEMSTLFNVNELMLQGQLTRSRYITGFIAVLTLALFAYGLLLFRSDRRLKKAHHALQTAHTKLEDAYGKLEETTTAKERIESELRIARDIQMGLVPQTFPAFPDRTDIDLYAAIRPARMVGGDLYDYVIQNNHLYFCLGDVSGKGVPASLFMTVACNLFRITAGQLLPPDEMAERMNNALARNNENGMFVTMFIGVIDLSTGHMDFCNCGHNPPALIQGEQSTFIELEPNAPLGLWPGLNYDGQSIENIDGEPLFIYSDGLNEAENKEHAQFGDERLLATLDRHPFENAHKTIEEMLEEVDKHVAGAEPSDDLTILCLRVNIRQSAEAPASSPTA
ncbi:MAG: SpoIIE family protein phosphatase [Prevotella sp.]|nr:SpoIIE family protein phosphatase [Prevotella sp.]